MAPRKFKARRPIFGIAPRKVLAGSHTSTRRRKPCYDRSPEKRHNPISRNGRHSQRPKSHTQDTASSRITANFKRPGYFTCFDKLPNELQNRIWEMLAEEPRVVAVNTKTDGGLRSLIPPILHVCSKSRSVGLKHYTRAFESQRSTHPETNNPEHKRSVPSMGIYFNFERDTLYFRENWNKNVKGAWCCLSQFTYLMNLGDLNRVKRVGFDVNVRICSIYHLADFASWSGLEILYLGYEDARLGSDCPITFSELKSRDYEDFMRRYNINPCWRLTWSTVKMSLWNRETIEGLRKEVPTSSYRTKVKKIEPVSVEHL